MYANCGEPRYRTINYIYIYIYFVNIFSKILQKYLFRLRLTEIRVIPMEITSFRRKYHRFAWCFRRFTALWCIPCRFPSFRRKFLCFSSFQQENDDDDGELTDDFVGVQAAFSAQPPENSFFSCNTPPAPPDYCQKQTRLIPFFDFFIKILYNYYRK